jgi:hypothetical protein
MDPPHFPYCEVYIVNGSRIEAGDVKISTSPLITEAGD